MPEDLVMPMTEVTVGMDSQGVEAEVLTQEEQVELEEMVLEV